MSARDICHWSISEAEGKRQSRVRADMDPSMVQRSYVA